MKTSLTLKMKTGMKTALALVAFAFLFTTCSLADTVADIFKAKCAACHGIDGKGNTAVGRTMEVRDLGSADVQSQSDVDLTNIISNGRNKMPQYVGKLTTPQIDDLVKFIRTLAPAQNNINKSLSSDIKSKVSAKALKEPAQSGSQYFLQVAVVRIQQDAEALLEALKAKQYSAFLATAGSDKMFRVEVGPFTDPKDTDSVRVKLVSDGYKPLERTFRSTVGDLGLPSGPIAQSRQELESLREVGGGTYTSFSLVEGDDPVAVSPFVLQLEKLDIKTGKFSLLISAGGRSISKSNKSIAEPLQLFSGADHKLYQIVVYEMAPGHVSGYLSLQESPHQVASNPAMDSSQTTAAASASAVNQGAPQRSDSTWNSDYDEQLKSAMVLWKSNQLSEAAKAVAALIKADPKRWEGYGLAGAIEKAQNRLSVAKAAYVQALSLAPESVKPQITEAIKQIEAQQGTP